MQTFRLTLLLTAVMMALVGCATDRLTVNRSSRLVPLVNSPEPGSAVGRCVHFGEEGPVTAPCPMDMNRVLAAARKNEARGRGSYAHGVFVQGSELPRLSRSTPAMATAYEMATYNSTERPLRSKLDAEGVLTVKRMCSDTSIQRIAVVLREFEGCAITLTGQEDEASGWTMKTLNQRGTFLGQPSAFWAQDPELETPPEKAKCRSQRVVQAEVLTVRNICAALMDKAGTVRPSATAASP